MKIKSILLSVLLALTFFVNAQTTISLNDLAAKKVKSTLDITISDNTIDFKGIVRPDGYWVKFTGTYSRPLHIKNLVNGELIFESTITTNTSDKTLKFTDCRDFKINGEKGYLYGSGNSSGQMIYVMGKWKNCYLKGFTIDQKRNGEPGATAGGAAVQFESYSDPSYSHGTLIIDGTVVNNSNDEPFYILYNQATKGYLDTLKLRNTRVKNAGRDFWQWANVRYSYAYNNTGTNGGLEQNDLHISGFSLNESNDYVILENNVVTKVPQFVYSGTIGGNVDLIWNTYIQDNHAGPRANQAIYTKTDAILIRNDIQTPAAKEAAITADNCDVRLIATSNTIVAPKLYRTFYGTVNYYTPPPKVKITTGSVQVEETTTWDGVTTIFIIYNGQRIQISK